jgi:hypothetical protein
VNGLSMIAAKRKAKHGLVSATMLLFQLLHEEVTGRKGQV